MDTATPVTAVAVGSESGTLAGVAVGPGPGLFTGLRVGVSTAKALAQAWGLPMVAVPSLDLIAFAHRHVQRAICPVIDARRGEVFCALYRHAPGGAVRVRRPDPGLALGRRPGRAGPAEDAA